MCVERIQTLLSSSQQQQQQQLVSNLCSVLDLILIGSESRILQDLLLNITPALLQSEEFCIESVSLCRSLILTGGTENQISSVLPQMMRVALDCLHQDDETLNNVVGLLGDLYNKVSVIMTPYTQRVETLLFTILSRDNSVELTNEVITALVEVILNSEGEDDDLRLKLTQHLLSPGLINSSTKQSVFPALSAVLQSKPSSPDISQLFSTHFDMIVSMIVESDGDDHRPQSIGLLGDLATHLPQAFQHTAKNNIDLIQNMISDARQSDDQKIQSLASWSAEQLRQVLNNNEACDMIDNNNEVEEEVFYNINVKFTNNQFITQNIETQNVTIKLPNKVQPLRTIECSNVQTTIRLSHPADQHDDAEDMGQAPHVSHHHTKRSARRAGIDEDAQQEKRWKFEF